MNARRQRRKLDPKWRRRWDAQFAHWRAEASRYADASGRIETIEMWESVDDKNADMQVAVNILEHMPDVNAALKNIRDLSRKCAMFFIELDAMRDAETWREIIGREFHIIRLDILTPGRIVVLCAVMTRIQDTKVVGAGSEEGRWAQMVQNSKAVATRLARQPKNDRRALLVCYGPSLKENWEQIIEDAKEGDADIISVSGAHDWLIAKGIVPRFHLECDPRPHKADNIARPIDGVTYLLASCASPVLFEKLKGGDISLWHASSEHNIRLINEFEPDAWVAGSGGSVGLRSIGLFYELGYRNFTIYGMDCSLSGDDEWAGPHAQKNGYKKHPVHDAYCKGRKFLTTKVLASYATSFFDIMRTMPDISYKLYGDGLLASMVKLYAETPFTYIRTLTQEEAAHVLHR